MGRKKIKNGAKLMMSFRYSEEQRSNWKRKAKKAGLKVSTWLKKLADKEPG